MYDTKPKDRNSFGTKFRKREIHIDNKSTACLQCAHYHSTAVRYRIAVSGIRRRRNRVIYPTEIFFMISVIDARKYF